MCEQWKINRNKKALDQYESIRQVIMRKTFTKFIIIQILQQ